ncbi:MAG: (2Fe-2S) ferredoxin domain-containing protein [Candidatus Methylomirabilaceae bacterium]
MGQYKRHVFICTTGDCCPRQGETEAYVTYLRKRLAERGLAKEIRINKSGCFSQCGHGPMVVVYPDDVWYGGVRMEDLDEILLEHLVDGRPVERLRYVAPPGPNKDPLRYEKIGRRSAGEPERKA